MKSFYLASVFLLAAGILSSLTPQACAQKINLQTQVRGVLPKPNGGTGTAAPALIPGTNITITGSWPNQTINSNTGTLITGSPASGNCSFFSGIASITGTVNCTLDSNGNLQVNSMNAGNGSTAGYQGWGGNPVLPTLQANNAALIGPANTVTTPYGLQFPVAGPSAAGVLHFGAPTLSISQLSFSPVVDADLSGQVGAAHGGTNVDLSAAGGAVNTTGKFIVKQDAAHVVSSAALIAADLPNTAVTPGSYSSTNLTVDAQGRITAASSGGGLGGGFNYATAFTSQTSVTLAGTSHNLGTKNLLVQCYDNASPANSIQPQAFTVNSSSFDVVVTFATPQSGYCTVNGSGPGVYQASKSSATSWSVTAATHGLGKYVIATAYDSSGNRVEPGKTNVDPSGNVTLSFAVAQTGSIVITQ